MGGGALRHPGRDQPPAAATRSTPGWAPLLGDLLPKVRAGGYPAGIVLPATTFWERNDVHTPWAGAGHCAIYLKQAIRPMHECRNDRAIFAELAQRLGINEYDDKTEEQWLRDLTKGRRRRLRFLPGRGRRPLRRAEGRGGLRRPDPRSRHP